MSLNPAAGRRSPSPTSSGRSSPVARTFRRTVDEGIYKADKSLRRYSTAVERALASWEISPQEWADYIAFLGRLLKAIQSHPKDAPLLPHSSAVASKLAQCLNPALPSGVHQKAIEVYSYVFSTFRQEYIASHLHEFLPGLASVLSFASLTVRPALYTIYEEQIATLPADDLRPVLKSLILSLLPAVEDETSEDFERAFRILEFLERKYSSTDQAHNSGVENDGYFWQCLFLAVITSSTRRQGALNFLNQRLPKFSTQASSNTNANGQEQDKLDPNLSPDAEAVILPEPGLLIRCFACGLADSQALIQRGYLDLLVSNLPLDSQLLQSRIRVEDLDRLVSSAVQVLLRREMSLNRRLWAWFLGPDPKTVETENSQSHSPTAERKQYLDAKSTTQLKYFSLYGRKPLERCILGMFRRNAKSAAQMAQPFRICLSLMDRWEIGGSIIPHIFVPAVESAYQYSLSASPEQTTEVIRSASLFFDGIEAKLIWENLVKLLRDDITNGSDHYNLRMFEWVVHRFNVSDEEMLTVHVPYALIYGLSILSDTTGHKLSTTGTDLLYDLVSYLLELVPERAFPEAITTSSNGKPFSSGAPDTTFIRRQLDSLYQAGGHSSAKISDPFGNISWTEVCYGLVLSLALCNHEGTEDRNFVRAASLLTLLHSKASKSLSGEKRFMFASVAQDLRKLAKPGQKISFPAISSIVSIMVALGTTQFTQPVINRPDLIELVPIMTAQTWEHLSPHSPKYNVEAVKAIWQLQDMASSDDCLEASLMTLVREGLSKRSSSDSHRTETCRKFAILWNHTTPTSTDTKRGSQGFVRKGSAMPMAADALQALNRQRILTGPLMLVLDELLDVTGSTYDFVRSWVQNLNSLDQVLKIHFGILGDLSRQESQDPSTNPKRCSRRISDMVRNLEYIVGHILAILKVANGWVWQTLRSLSISPASEEDDVPAAAQILVHRCMGLLQDNKLSSTQLQTQSIEVLEILLNSPLATALKGMELDSGLLNLLTSNLSLDKGELQVSLLKLITKALQLRLSPDTREHSSSPEPRSSITTKRPDEKVLQQSPTSSSISLAALPPPQLLNCLKMGFSTSAARPHMDRWLAFLSNVLPVYADAIFASIIPLVECLCAELEQSHSILVSMSQTNETADAYAPEIVALSLLDALEMVLARAHECLAIDQNAELMSRSAAQPRSILGNMTSGVFKSEAVPTRTAQANSRLTVILTFQDAIRVSTKLWTWASHSSETASFDKSSAATTTYNALKLRNRTRYLLEQMFEHEPLESLETLIYNWYYATNSTQASATLDLLLVMQGMRPKSIIPTILDSICSRTNPSALPTQRQSSQTIDLAAVDITTFLFAYLQSIEDDAMDEVWPDCMAFLRDVLSNPLPHRQVLPALLLVAMLLAQKIDNTNFGEQRKMRRDLGDIFLRLLGATFTTMPSGYILEPEPEPSGLELAMFDDSIRTFGQKSRSLAAVLTEVTANLEVILETSDRVLNAVNNISSHLISPIVHAKSFPANVNREILSLFLQVAKRAPSAKQWKKDLTDAFNDPRLLTTKITQMENAWFPLLHHWCLYDKERMPELLSRLSPPSSAGIMFGVGASAARLEADRKTQLNVRRICILLLCAPEDSFVIHSRAMEEKLVELFEASASSSPSSSIKAELFMLCRALVLSTSAIHLAPFWPIINDNLQSALLSLLPSGPTNVAPGNLALLQACKLLDLLVTLSPEEFQLHEWLYITDTVDAVYQPPSWTPSALSDHVAESLTSDVLEEGASMIPPTPIASDTSGRRRQLINNSSMTDIEDIKASTREDFAHAIVRPFLSQLSLHAYEGVYSMDSPDVRVCRHSLLENVLDLRTIVE